jgi:hypothetical protein
VESVPGKERADPLHERVEHANSCISRYHLTTEGESIDASAGEQEENQQDDDGSNLTGHFLTLLAITPDSSYATGDRLIGDCA